MRLFGCGKLKLWRGLPAYCVSEASPLLVFACFHFGAAER